MSQTKEKDNNLYRKLFIQLVGTNLLVNMVQPLNQIIDTILTGRGLGANALEAYALFLPINSFMIAMSCLFSKGNQISCSHLIGRGKAESAKRMACTALGAVLFLTVIFTFVLAVFSRQIAMLIGASKDVENQIRDTAEYIRCYAFGIPAAVFLDVLMCLMQLEGKRIIVVVSSICVLVMNIAGDLANIYLFRRGIMGMACATVVANISAFCVMLIYFCKKSKLFSFSLRGFHKEDLLQILKNGAPGLSYFGSLVVRSAFMNMLIITRLDRSILVSLLVFTNFGILVDVIIGGHSDSIVLLGGVLYGEKDKEEAESLLKFACKTGAVEMALIALATAIFSKPIATLFLNENDLIYVAFAAQALKLAALYLIPDMIACIEKKYIQTIGNGLYTAVTNVICNIAYACGSAWILVVLLGEKGLFLSYTVCYVIAMISNTIYIYFFSGKRFVNDQEKILEARIIDIKECVEVSEEIYRHCKEHGMDKKRSFLISLFTEELTKNVVTHGFSKKHDNMIMVKLMTSEESATLCIKDNCRYFDPTKYYEFVKERDEGIIEENSAGDASKMGKGQSILMDDGSSLKGFGIRMLMKLSKNVTYMNSLSLNNLKIEV